jgi:hypothetical protein
MTTDNGAQLTLDCRRCGVNGKVTVTARLGDKPVYVHTFDITCAKQRDAYAAAVAQKCPGIDVTELQEELLRLADEHVQEGAKRAGDRPLPEANGQADQASQQDSNPDDPPQPGHSCQRGKKSQATVLLELVRNLRLEFWCTPKQEAWVSIPKDGHTEHWKVRSRAFQAFLRGLFFDKRKKSISSQNISDALGTMECWSIHKGPEYQVAMRIGQANKKLYLDLADEQWRAVEVDADGWRVITDPPIRFKRAPGMLPLPEPDPQGRVDLLREFIRVDDPQWALLAAWLLGALHPDGPYPVLVLHGEQGTGKSTTARMLRALLDPSEADTRTSPRDERDLMIAANNGWVVNLDNLSEIPPWLSDSLCRLSTGGGFTTRELYTDDSEVLFAAKRPIVLNGIPQVAERDDLLDRSLLVKLSPIPEAERLPEKVLWARFGAAKAAILGGLLNAAAEAWARRDSIPLLNLPRMADFAIWAMAGEDALGLQPGEFMGAYGENRGEAVEESLEASPIYRPFVKAFTDTETWEGTASELLDDLNEKATDEEKRQYGWPKNPKKMGNIMKRLAPSLRKVGWEVKTGLRGSGGRRVIRIERAGKVSSQTSQTPQTAENTGKSALSVIVTPKTPVVTLVTRDAPRSDVSDVGCQWGAPAVVTTQAVTPQRLTQSSDKSDKSDNKKPTFSKVDPAAQHGPSPNAHKAEGQVGDSQEEELGDLSDLFEDYTPDKEWRSL